jgi:hypothetical protein
MRIASVEFREPCALANPSLRTTVLLPESHEWELLENGWLKWRMKGGKWYASPPCMVRNVCLYEEVPTISNTEVSRQSQDPALIQDRNPQISMQQDPSLGLPKRRGKKA